MTLNFGGGDVFRFGCHRLHEWVCPVLKEGNEVGRAADWAVVHSGQEMQLEAVVSGTDEVGQAEIVWNEQWGKPDHIRVLAEQA